MLFPGKLRFGQRSLSFLVTSNCWHKVPLSYQDTLLCHSIFFGEFCVFEYSTCRNLCDFCRTNCLSSSEQKDANFHYFRIYADCCDYQKFYTLIALGVILIGSFHEKDLSHKQVIAKCCELQAQIYCFIWEVTSYDASVRFPHMQRKHLNTKFSSWPTNHPQINICTYLFIIRRF